MNEVDLKIMKEGDKVILHSFDRLIIEFGANGEGYPKIKYGFNENMIEYLGKEVEIGYVFSDYIGIKEDEDYSWHFSTLNELLITPQERERRISWNYSEFDESTQEAREDDRPF